MNKKVTLHFFCGKMAAGKSTLAKEIALKYNAILIIEDDWLSQLYPEEITNITSYIKYSDRLKTLLLDYTLMLLTKGLSVVLDFPANTINQRNWFREIFEKENISHVLHYVNVSNELCIKQLKERSKDKPKGSAFTSEAEFYEITKYFQAPEESEGFNINRYQR